MIVSTPAASGPELRDIHLPPAPPWWPPAPGWWLLAALTVLVLLGVAWAWRRRARLQRQRRQLLDELARLEAQHVRDGDAAALAAALQQLLRRVARRQDAAAVRQRGESWRQTLARVPVATPVLDRLLSLEQAIYRPQASFDAPATLAAARTWLHAAARPRAWKDVVAEPGRG